MSDNPAEGTRLADRIEKSRGLSLMEQPQVPGPVWAMPLSDAEQQMIVAALRSQGGSGEPVAWRIAGKVSVLTWRKEVAEKWADVGDAVQPLYAAPTPSPAVHNTKRQDDAS